MSRSHEHKKALNDLAQHTGDSTNDRLERLKKIEKLRLQGYQKLKSLTGEKSGTPISPTRRSYSNFSPETSPSVYGSLGRIDHLGGVKPKSYSSQSYQTESQKNRSSSLSDEEGENRPKHLLRSRSATTVSDAALSAFQSSEQSMSYSTGAVDEYWKEAEDSYNEDDENIEDFKRSLFGDIGAYTNKTSPRTDGTLQSFSLSRAWSSGGADYDDPSLKGGDSKEATEDSGVDISMFPSYDTEFLGMNYGETFENPYSYGTTIRKSFSRDRSRQPLLRSFSSHQESMPGSSLSSIDYTDPNISRLDSAQDRGFNTSGLTGKISANQEREKRIESALDNIFSSSRGSDERTSISSDRQHVYERGGRRTMSSTVSRYGDRYAPETDSYSLRETSYTQRGLSSGDYTPRHALTSSSSLPSERKKIGLSAETERKLDELFSTPASISNRPSFTSRSLRTETPSIRNRSDKIVITRRKTEDPNVRKVTSGSVLDQKRDNSFHVPDVLSTRMLDDESYGSAPSKDPSMRNTSAQSTLDQKLDNLFGVPDVLSTNVSENEMYETTQDTISSSTGGYDFEHSNISEDTGTRNVSAQSSLDQKLDSLFGNAGIHSTKIRENKNYETARNKVSSKPLNSKEKPTLSSMLYGTENKSMESGETILNGQPRRERLINITVPEIRRKRHRDQQASQQSYTDGEDGSEMVQQSSPAVTMRSSEVITGSVDVDTIKIEDTVIGENKESFDQEHSTAVETLTNVEVGLEDKQTNEDKNIDENGFHGDSIVKDSSKLEGSRTKTDLLQENDTIDISFQYSEQQNQSSEMVNMVQESNIIERDETKVTEEQQKLTKGKQTDSKKGKKKSKNKKSKGKKGQKENIEKEITKKVSGKPVLETDIDFPLAEEDAQNITEFQDCENEVTQSLPSQDKIGGITQSIQKMESNIQAGDEEIYIQTENKEEEEEEERYIQAEESSQIDNQVEKEVHQIPAEVLKETPIEETNLESETITNSKSTLEPHESQGQTSWLRTKFNSLLHGFSTDSSETQSYVQEKVENIDMVSGKEEVYTTNDVNIVTFSDTGTVSEDDFATASDDSTTKHSDQDHETKYKQSVLDANIKNEEKSTEMSDENDKMDIFSELAATTGMSLDIDEQNSVNMEGHIVYKREEELLRYEKDDTPGRMQEFDGEEVDVEQQEIYVQSEESVYLCDEFINMKEMDLKDEENNNESKKLGMTQIKDQLSKSDTSVQMEVFTAEISIQTDVEACLKTDKVSAHVQTLPLKVDKWTQTDPQQAPDNKEFGIQASPTTADYSAQYDVSVRESGTQVVNKLDTDLDLETEYSDQGKPEGQVLLEQVKSEHHSAEQVEQGAVLKVDPVRIVTDKLTPEYAVAEKVKLELVAPEQVKLGGRQLSNTSEDVSVIVESKEHTVKNHPTELSEHENEKLKEVYYSTAETEVGLTNVSIQSCNVTKNTQSVEGHTTSNETINTWSNISAVGEITFTSQSLGKKVPPQPLPKRRTKHGSTRPSSRPSSIVSEGEGYDFHASGQSTTSLESSSFNFNKILQKTDIKDAEMPSGKGHGPLSPGKVPTGSSSTLLTMTVGPTSPKTRELSIDAKESTTALSNVTSPRSSLSGMASLGSHINKGNVKSPPPALLPKRKATSQLQMPTSPKSPTSPRTTEKLELVQECDPVFAKQMKMNNGKQEIIKEPLNRLKDNPFIRKDVNVKSGRQESFSKKCEISTSSKPRTLSSSLAPKSPKNECKDTGGLTLQTDHSVKCNVLDKKGTTRDMTKANKDDVVDLSVLDSRSLRSEIIRQSTSRSSARNIPKKTKNVDNIRSKLDTSTGSSGKKETSSIVNKIISNTAKFEAKFSSGSSPIKEEVSTKTVLEQTPLERDNPFIQPTDSITFSRKVSSDFDLGKENSVYVETSFDGDEVQTSTVSQVGQVADIVRQEEQRSEGIHTDTKVQETQPSTVMQTDKNQELENTVVPPQRKLKVQIPPPGKPEGQELVLDSPSLASLVSSELEDIGVGKIAGLTTKADSLQNSPRIGETKTNLKSDQQKAVKPPSPKTGKPPSPKSTKTPPPRRNRPLSPKVGKTPPSPQSSKSPKFSVPSSPRGVKSTSGSTPPSPGGKPPSPRKGQSPLSKAMFGDRESGKPGSEITGDSWSGRRSFEKTGSNSSRASSVSSEGSSSPEKVDARYEMHISPEEQKGVALDEDDDDDEVLPSRINIRDWNPTKLLCDLYTVKLAKEEVEDVSDKFVCMEGLMEKLPMNKKKSTLLKTWKRRFFRAKDGWLHYFETNNRDRPSDSVQLMGGRIEDLGNRILGIDDGRGRYLMVRCPTDKEYGQWKLALESQTVDNVKATYVRPILKSPPNPRRKVVLIDIGSCSIRAGILGQEATLPEVFFPSTVARNKDSSEIHIGIKAYHPDVRKTSTLMKAVRPTNKMDKSETVFNVDTEVMPAVLQKIFTDLNVDSTKYWIMMSTPQNLADQLKAALFEILIGQFRVKGVCMVMQSLLALYSYQKTSGILVDIGQRMEILPICDGYVIEGGVSRQSYGGQKIEDSLNSSLTENKYVFGTPVEQLILRHIMEQSCYVAEDYDAMEKKCAADPASCQSTVFLDKYDLPEGVHRQVIHDRSCYHSPEGFFNTDLWGMDYPCVHNLVFKAIQYCPIDSRKHMYRAVYLSGGVTMLPGFAERLQKELIKLAPPSVIVEVHASPHRYHAAYIGASSLANMDMFEQTCITGDEWARNGVKAFAKWAMQSS